MNTRKLFAMFLGALTATTLSATCWAADIVLKLATQANGNHKYYHLLLEESLKAAGHTVKIEPEDNLPQPRIVSYIDEGKLTLHYFLQTKERDAKYVPVNHKLTQGLIGQRVMLIPKGDESVYTKVKSLEDLKASGKVAGLGKGWFDVSVWNESGLPVLEQGGEWKYLYKMIASKDRGIDYFPRGAIEILAEAKEQPSLAIEPNLLLVYPRDFIFYLSKPNALLQPILEAALKQAEKSGLQKKLIDEYFGPQIATLHLDKRTRINLKNPTSN
ncbi:MAG: ABC transporter substrate-binding protein [Rhodoferax sp.]|nr:ABC transporter substrate-binding protein [Rhodoferax sp.]